MREGRCAEVVRGRQMINKPAVWPQRVFYGDGCGANMSCGRARVRVLRVVEVAQARQEA